MNTKQLTYPTLKIQEQYWIDKEAVSDNANNETRDPVYLCENCGTPITGKFHIAQAGTNKRWHWSKCDASHLSQSASDTANPKPKEEELSRTESLTDWYDHGRNV